MIKQLKAEVFRMVNSGGMRFGSGVYYLGALLALMCLFPFSEDWGRLNEPLSAALGYFVQESYIIFLIMQIVVVCLLIRKYQTRVYYYEIMHGESIRDIILGTGVAYGGYGLLVVLLPNIVLYTVVAVRSGVGSYEDVTSFVIAYAIILLRFVLRAVFITMIARSIVPALAGVYLLFLGEQAILSVIQAIMNVETGIASYICYFFPSQQFVNLYQPLGYSDRFLAMVLVSFVVEVVALYVLTESNYKAKKFR